VTEITFYTLPTTRSTSPAASPPRRTARAAGDDLRAGPTTADAIDRLLWTTPALGFVPHCRDSDALAGETPVLIGANPDALRSADVMINLHHEQPPAFARFERLVEITA
jgi:DNA polymerase-3 subunit chi